MRNFYIERDNKNIVGLFTRPQYEGQEVLSEDDQEMIDHFANQKAVEDAEKNRIAEIEVEKDAAGLKKTTLQQAYDKIDQIFSRATTIALLRAACIRAFKILVVFILR